jgi:hypothetical protein
VALELPVELEVPELVVEVPVDDVELPVEVVETTSVLWCTSCTSGAYIVNALSVAPPVIENGTATVETGAAVPAAQVDTATLVDVATRAQVPVPLA